MPNTLHDLQKPAQAQAGRPVTANAWNVIVDGVNGLLDYLLTTEASAVRVAIANTGIRLDTVRVTAVPKDASGVAADAIAPVPPGVQFTFPGLKPGGYTISAIAPGFAVASQEVTVPAAAVVNLTLTPNGAFMPGVFGAQLPQALSVLADAGITVDQILDAAGNSVPPKNVGVDYGESLVIAQMPQPGDVVLSAGGTAQLVVAASLKVEATVEVPSLIGLTEAEARKALEALGLRLGKVEQRMRTIIAK